jgi:hypothetical protein
VSDHDHDSVSNHDLYCASDFNVDGTFDVDNCGLRLLSA